MILYAVYFHAFLLPVMLHVQTNQLENGGIRISKNIEADFGKTGTKISEIDIHRIMNNGIAWVESYMLDQAA